MAKVSKNDHDNMGQRKLNCGNELNAIRSICYCILRYSGDLNTDY